MISHRHCIVSLLLIALVGMSYGQTPEVAPVHQDSGHASIVFLCDGAAVDVHVDSTDLGPCPCRADSLTPGIHIIKYRNSGAHSWMEVSRVDTVNVSAGASLTLHAAKTRYIHLTTEPSDADVFVSDSLLGHSPIVLYPIDSLSTYDVSKNGFRRSSFPADELSGEYHLVLVRDGLQAMPESQYLAIPPVEKSMTDVYVTTAVTVVAGVSAAYFKIKADNNYSDYLQTGDRANLDKVHRNDLAAGISLAVSQAGVAFLTYLLLSR